MLYYTTQGIASLTGIADGLGYGILSLSETATAFQDFFNKEIALKNNPLLIPIAIAPAIAALGVIGLNFHENKEFIKRLFNRNLIEQEAAAALPNLKTCLKEHPLEASLIIIGACIDSLITYNSTRMLVNQFGYSLSKLSLVYPTLLLALLNGLQVVLLTGRVLISTIRNGYEIYDYERIFDKKLARYFAKAIINTLPLVSATSMGLLALIEVNSAGQDFILNFEPKDIAQRLSWIPAIALSVIYFSFRYVLYGQSLKQFLADKLTQFSLLNNKAFFNNNLKPNLRSIKDNFLKLFMLGVASAAFMISFGSLDEAAYTFAYGVSPTLPLDDQPSFKQFMKLFPLGKKFLFFAIPALCLALETVVAQGPRWQEILGCAASAPIVDQELIATRPKKTIGYVHSENYYTLPKLVADSFIVALASGLVIALDKFFIPAAVAAEDISISQMLMIAIIFSIFATLANFIYRALNNKNTVNDCLQQAGFESDDSTPSLIANEETGLLPRKTSNSSNYSSGSILLSLLFRCALVLNVVFWIEFLTRYMLFSAIPSEEKNRLDIAENLALLGGSMSVPIVYRNGAYLENKIVSIGTKVKDSVSSLAKNMSGFFYHNRDEVTPVIREISMPQHQLQ